jgi:hypothetical protein
LETHLPNAFRLLRLVPYLSANSDRPSSDAPPHFFAALRKAAASCLSFSSAAALFSFARCETHLPNALCLFLFVPYFSWNA